MDFIFVKKLIVPFVILIAIIFGYFLFNAPKNFPAGEIVNINEGVSLRFLSKDLEIKNIIKSRVAFETFVIMYGGEKHIAPGYYLFENKVSVFEVARRIVKGDRHLAPIKITIPEGYSISDIADTVAVKLPNFNKDKFLLETKNKINKEGYLFPDTYFFFVPSTEEDVINTMSDNFENKIKTLKNEIATSGKSEKDIINMASIIEKEAKGDMDRGLISGILWKRVNKNMLLQVDAESSTYKIKGLPINPICNPGLDSIKSAIHPVNSDYLYYLHDKNGVAHYAKTFAEHKLNIQKYLK
ncbi:MAG: endolytic transglycosylase MltG [Patescibacteria group bacterium]